MIDDNSRKRVFLSYSFADVDKATLLADRLKNKGVTIQIDHSDDSFGENIFDKLKYLIQSSDFVLLLLTKSFFKSKYAQFEYTQAFYKFTGQRKASVIPVLMEKCDIPSDFLEYEILNLTTDFDKGLDKLTQRINTIPEVSFENFTPRDFIEVIHDLLVAYGFKNIKREYDHIDTGIDFIAEYFSSNPFGQKRKEHWMIGIKFYSESRFDIRTIKQFAKLYKNINKENVKLLLITNSQINSVVEDYLNDLRKENKIDIEVIDGLLLKKLIVNKKRILSKYFLK